MRRTSKNIDGVWEYAGNWTANRSREIDDVRVALLGEDEPAVLHLDAGDDCFVVVELPDGRTVDGAGPDFYEALCQVRVILRQAGRTLLCAGARRDVHPSRMQRQAVRARKAYVVGTAGVGGRPLVVDIFDPAESGDIATVDSSSGSTWSRWRQRPRAPDFPLVEVRGQYVR
jgi:hypothetical protein